MKNRAVLPRWMSGCRIGLSVLLGAVTTWVIAWVCALPIPRGEPRVSFGAAVVENRLVKVIESCFPGARNRAWMLDDLSRDNIHAKSAQRQADQITARGGAAAMSDSVEGARAIMESLGRTPPSVPAFGAIDEVAARGPPWRVEAAEIPDGGLTINEFACGWPWRWLRCRSDIRVVEAGVGADGRPVVVRRGLEVNWPGSAGGGGGRDCVLPLDPMWAGFAASTGVYAGVWFGVLALVSARRGRPAVVA